MAEKKRWIPFAWWPANWGLEGKRRQEERARYYLEGKELEEALLEIEFPTVGSKETPEYRLKKLAIDHDFGEIDSDTYEREKATAENKPYFKVIYGEYAANRNGDGQMTFELDWNSKFVEELSEAGWEGYSEDQIVNNWFEDACKQMFEDENVQDDGHSFVQSSSKRIKKTDLGEGRQSIS